MANDNSNLDINIGVNATSAEQGASKAKKAIGSISGESRELQRAFRSLKSAIDPTFQAQEKYNRSLENYKKLLSLGLVSQKEYRAGLRAAKADLDAQIQSINKNSEANRKAAAEKVRTNQQASEKAKQLAREEIEAARQVTQAKIAAAREERKIKSNIEAQEQRAIRLAAQMARQAASEANRGVRRGGATQRGVDPGSIQTQQSLAQLEAAYKRTYEAAANHARKAAEAASAAAEASNSKQARSAQARAEREKQIAQDYSTKAIGIARTIASVEGQTKQERVAAERLARAQEKAAAREAAQVAIQAARAKAKAARDAAHAVHEAAIETKKLAQAERVANETVQQMRSSIDPVYAAQQRYNHTMATATQLLMQNKLRQGEWTAIQRNAKAQMDLNVRSMGRMNSVYVQLGYQAQDVTASLASGINPLVILAQQGGQTAAALAQMDGKVGAVASFFAGPWGAAIIGFTMLLGFLWDSMKEGEESTKDLMRAEDRRKMSVKELTEAIKEYTRNQEEANNTTLEGKRIQMEAAEESRKQVIAQYERADAEVKATQKWIDELKTAGPTSALATGLGGPAAHAAALVAAYVKLKMAQADVTRLQTGYTNAIKGSVEAAVGMSQAIADAGALGVAEQNELQAITEKYRVAQAAAVGDTARINKLVSDQAAEIVAVQEKYNKLKEKETAARRENAKAARDEAQQIQFTMPVQGTITGRFGEKRPGHSHSGMDIAAPMGTAVKAPQVGVVTAVGWSDTYGKYVVINHGGGTTTKYAHLSSQDVVENQTVQQGQTIGKVGSTGRSTGPHLHYEVKEGGKFVDPTRGSFKADTLGAEAGAYDEQIKAQHDAAVADLEFKQELAGDDLQLVLDLQDQKIALIKDYYGKESAEAIDASRQRIRTERQQMRESNAIRMEGIEMTLDDAEQTANKEKALIDQRLSWEKKANDFLLASNQITQEEAFRRKAMTLDKEYQAAVAHENKLHNLKLEALGKQLLLDQLTLSQRLALNREISDEKLAHEQRMFDITLRFSDQTQELQYEIMAKMEEKWRELGQTIEQSLSQAFQNIWTRTGSFWQSMVNLADQMVYQAFINPMAKVVSDWIVKQAKLLFIKKATDTAVAASSVAADAIVTGSSAKAAMAQTGAAATAGTSEIGTHAAVAAAGAYKSTVVIPFIGPVAAPVAAALALAAVLGFASLISAKGGQGEVKHDGQLTQLHKKEMVLPAYIAEPLRQGLSSPSSGLFGGAAATGSSIRSSVNQQHRVEMNLNYSPQTSVESMGMEELLRKDSRSLRKWIIREMNNGNLSGLKR